MTKLMWLDVGRDPNIVLGGGVTTSKIVVGGGCWPPRSSWFFCRPTTKIVEVTQRFDQTHNKSSDANCYQSCCGWGRTTTNYIAYSFLYTHNKKSLFRKLRFRCGSIKCHINRRCSAPNHNEISDANRYQSRCGCNGSCVSLPFAALFRRV